MIKALVGLLTGAVASVLLVALDHILAAVVVAVVTVAVVVTLLVFARRGIQRATRAVHSATAPGPARPPRVR